MSAEVLMATPCTNSLGGESGEQKHEGCGGRSACWKYAAVSGAGASGRRVKEQFSRQIRLYPDLERQFAMSVRAATRSHCEGRRSRD